MSPHSQWFCSAGGLQAFQEIEKKFVTENIFSQYCYKTLPNATHLWLFKKQFCMQMALSGALPSPPSSAAPTLHECSDASVAKPLRREGWGSSS